VNGIITQNLTVPLMFGQGNNYISGTIEGLGGTPIHIRRWQGFSLRDLHMEANGPKQPNGGPPLNPARSTIENCALFTVSCVKNVGASGGATVGELYLTNVSGASVDVYEGMLTQGPNCANVQIGVTST
jgi:hypothetical protein